MVMLWNYEIAKGGVTMEDLTMLFKLYGDSPRGNSFADEIEILLFDM